MASVLDVMTDPTGEHRREEEEKKKDKEGEGGGEGEEVNEEYCPFPDDKYIDENEWSNPLVKMWLTKVAQPSRVVALDDTFNGFILFVIIIAGVLVGVQTYDGMEFNSIVNNIDFVVLVCFCVECVLKIFAEGLAPWRFWVGECWTIHGWRWMMDDLTITNTQSPPPP